MVVFPELMVGLGSFLCFVLLYLVVLLLFVVCLWFVCGWAF